jgi:hypothetical protein
MSTTFVAVTPLGTFARTSQNRVYSHVVASRDRSAADLRRMAEKRLQADRDYLAEYEAVVEGRQPITGRLTLEHYQRFVVDTRAQIAADEAALAATDFEAESQRVTVWGWASRVDLAESVANKARRYGFTDVRVFPCAKGGTGTKSSARKRRLS